MSDVAQLESLHNAIVSEIAFAYTDDSKTVHIIITGDEACVNREWAGRAVAVTLTNVLRVSGALLGHVAGRDVINSISNRTSTEMRRSIQELSDAGIITPRILLRLTLRSGSEIEIACDEIHASVQKQ